MHFIFSTVLIMRYEPRIIIIPRSKMRKLEPGRLCRSEANGGINIQAPHSTFSSLLYTTTPSNLYNLPISHLTSHHQYLPYNLAFKEYLYLSNLNHLKIQKTVTKKREIKH